MLDDTGLPFRELREEDIDEIVLLGEDFFAESEVSGFATYAPEHFRAHLQELTKAPAFRGFVFRPELNQSVQGFAFYQLDHFYTREPIALGSLFYVSRLWRRSPAGRSLLKVMLADAKAHGARAFYGGVMSGIRESQQSMANMFGKHGFEPVGYWGRKVL